MNIIINNIFFGIEIVRASEIAKMLLNSKCISILIVIVAFISIQKCKAFNVSPKPNVVLHEPIAKINAGMAKMRSSYFGFSINLKRNR